MNLLFDQNLSHELVRRLADLFPKSAHVRDAALGTRDDIIVWDYARTNGFVIVSKDEDFRHLSFVRGAPPRVIGIQLGNCTTDAIEQLTCPRATSTLATVFCFTTSKTCCGYDARNTVRRCQSKNCSSGWKR